MERIPRSNLKLLLILVQIKSVLLWLWKPSWSGQVRSSLKFLWQLMPVISVAVKTIFRCWETTINLLINVIPRNALRIKSMENSPSYQDIPNSDLIRNSEYKRLQISSETEGFPELILFISRTLTSSKHLLEISFWSKESSSPKGNSVLSIKAI